MSKQVLGPLFVDTMWLKLIDYFEELILSSLLISLLILKLVVLVPEEILMIKGVNYSSLIRGEKEARGP